jgi:hypothetical protein
MFLAVVAGLTAIVTVLTSPPVQSMSCKRCAWHAPAAARTISVRTVADLEHAVQNAREGDEIVLADGVYRLERTLEIAVPKVTLRSRNGDPARVAIEGQGMTGDRVGVAVAVGAPEAVVADLTIRAVGFHAVQVRGERSASRFTLHNAVLEDTGQQLLKGSAADNGQYAGDGLVACSTFRYSSAAPSDYTNGIDILGTRRWVIRDNQFFRIRGPRHAAGPAILAWRGAEDTMIERNLIVDSFRGIALGLMERSGSLAYDHLRGTVRNNIVMNEQTWADEAIEVNGAPGAAVYHNTVLVAGQMPWSISVRFATSSAEVRNNLTNKSIASRDGGRITARDGNVNGATAAWFINVPMFDFRLSPSGERAVDSGIVLDSVSADFDRLPRVFGPLPDAGALERRESR